MLLLMLLLTRRLVAVGSRWKQQMGRYKWRRRPDWQTFFYDTFITLRATAVTVNGKAQPRTFFFRRRRVVKTRNSIPNRLHDSFDCFSLLTLSSRAAILNLIMSLRDCEHMKTENLDSNTVNFQKRPCRTLGFCIINARVHLVQNSTGNAGQLIYHQ